MILVGIGRTNGPITDKRATTRITPEQVDLFMDVIAMVNAVTNDKERWWVEIDGKQTVPILTDESWKTPHKENRK